ncbi:GMP reductase 2-like [Homarus americanus]|uniref:GMP reductase 2-like 2 n=1 Tax=Homarus americanus TaxID=6706 RepID=A0A8J5JLM5_HOMAM|nr:GMP reductase 2-like [Homarus americanus]KAG7158538.1 GMP reductase 2-like 2 [Homarus americanus]
MPRIDNDIKLDFKDVLLRPKRSTLKSRSEVDLNRTIIFRNSKVTWTGIPIIAANMDTVGTFEMAQTLAKHKCFTTIHKHYSIEEWKEFGENNKSVLEYVAASSGISNTDWDRLQQVLSSVPEVRAKWEHIFLCLIGTVPDS